MNQDGSIVVVIVNPGEQTDNLSLTLNGKTTEISLPEHSISSLLITE